MRILISGIIIAMFVGWVTAAGGADTATVRVDGLRCEGQSQPLGIDVADPVLGWQMTSDRRGAAQTGYQVLVSGTPESLAKESGEVWDSGRVASDVPRATYAGRPLASAERVYWTVRVWDETGAASAWSAPGEWTMGLLRAEDWQGQWIGGPEPRPALQESYWIWTPETPGLSAPPGPCYFRRVFSLKAGTALQAAHFYLSGDNEYEWFLNEKPMGKCAVYNAAQHHEIGKTLLPGRNVLAVKVTNGGKSENPAGLITRLELEYADGTKEVLLSDEQWRCRSKAGQGWKTAGFNDQDWPTAQKLIPFGQKPWDDVSSGNAQALPIFRKRFEVADKPVQRAMAYVCGLGQFELFVNGQKTGDHFLDPGWTNYRKTCLYVPFDVTSQLRAGENVLGAMLGNGMYNVPGGRYTKFTGSFGLPKLMLHLRIDYADGTTETVISDGSWRTAEGPVQFSCIYGGEDYDARKEQPGWAGPGFDDAGWGPVRVVDAPGGVLRAPSEPPIKVMRTLQPVSIRKTAPGEYAVDMDFNLSARPVLTVKGAAGSQVTVRVAERAEQPWEGHSYTYTLRGEGVETYRPYFTYFGFQYLYVSGADRPEDAGPDSTRPVLLDIGSDFVTSDSAQVGAFRCGNDLFNDIEAMIDRSVRSNLQSVVTDCPHREKLGWLEVPHLMGPSILYHYDVFGLYRKICRDTTESQLDSGLVPDIAPEYTRFSGGFFESAEWGSACVQIPWLLYQWYGDEAILARQFDTMAKYTRYLAETRNAQGLAKGGLGDWYDWTPEKGHAGAAQWTPAELTATAMLYDNARLLTIIGRLLGKPQEADFFDALAQKVRQDFLAAYYDAEKRIVAQGSQAALSVGLHFGLVPDSDRAAVTEALVRSVESMNYRPTTGEVCFRYMVQALAAAGRSDVIYRIINRTDAPGYGCMLRQYGLKTLSEQWDKPGSSLNHCMFGHIQEWFQGNVLGIRQAEGSLGFARLSIAPSPTGDLMEARGYYDGPRGRIAVSWHQEGDTFTLDVTIPGNTTAVVTLPVDAQAPVMESEQPVASALGVAGVETVDRKPVVTVGAGQYRFTGTRKAGA